MHYCMAYKKQAFYVYERLNYVLKPNNEKSGDLLMGCTRSLHFLESLLTHGCDQGGIATATNSLV